MIRLRRRPALVLATLAVLACAPGASAAVASKYYVAFVKFDQTIRSSNGRPGNTILETNSVTLKSAPALRHAGTRASDRTVFNMRSVRGTGRTRIVETQPEPTLGCTFVSTTVASRFSATVFPLIWFTVAGGLLQPVQTTSVGESPALTTYSGCPNPPPPRTLRVQAFSGAVNPFLGIDGQRRRAFGVPIRITKVVRSGDDKVVVRTALLPCPGTKRCTKPPGSAKPFG